MKKGSALLIVLGMISFMLFSGLAFSVYMRQTRLPSSFLRRTTLTRQLTKAALAEAIADIDFAINSAPHPGVPKNDSTDKRRGDYKFRNYWVDRIFVGKKPKSENWQTSSEEESDDDEETGNETTAADALVSRDSTVSTLSLEGLAYLPPSLINEARYYSRRTPTAQWHRFRFDAGRYAYCAIDVSDYFDVNRVQADCPRAASGARRITLAHLFDKNVHKERGEGADVWDDWLHSEVRTVDQDTDEISFNGKTPLVSLADFNLAMYAEMQDDDKYFGGMKSPFIDYLVTSDMGRFYSDAGKDKNDEIAEIYRSMTFVTDSLLKSGDGSKDLEDSDNQPFGSSSSKLTGDQQMSIKEVYNHEPPDGYMQFLSQLGLCMLCDYLDENSEPISLAIPTVEKVPMVSALRISNSPEVKLTVKRSTTELTGPNGAALTKQGVSRTVCQTVYYCLNGGQLNDTMGKNTLDVLSVYPFLRDTPKNFKLDGQLLFFLSDNDAKFNLVEPALNSSLDIFSYPQATEFNTSQMGKLGIITTSIAQQDRSEVNSPQLHDVDGDWKFKDEFKLDGEDKYWMRLAYTWTQTRSKEDAENGDDDAWEPAFDQVQNLSSTELKSKKYSCDIDCRWPLVDETGNVMNGNQMREYALDAKKSFKLNMALWLRMLKGGNTVDMVPAGIQDDFTQGLQEGSVNQLRMSGGAGAYNAFKTTDGLGHHIMRFDVATGIKIADIKEQKEFSGKFSPSALMVADPRYNNNPLNWFTIEGAGDLKSAWESGNHASDRGRDGDIYMSVSDQGYLQSFYELAFLPRDNDVSGGKKVYKAQYGGNFADVSSKQDLDKYPDSFGNTLQSGMMWHTYQPFIGSNGGKGGNDDNTIAADNFDLFFDLGYTCGGSGLKVNPYSDSLEVLSAAFANTPMDWAHASTNATMNSYCSNGEKPFNMNCAWNAYGNSSLRMSWDFMQDLAKDFQDAIEDVIDGNISYPYNSSDSYYEKAYKSLWDYRVSGFDYYDQQDLCGIEFTNTEDPDSSYTEMKNTKVYSVDKKFLYGFWRDCFAANQQLFLVFVRAEPMMMGGGVAGNAPPQLSARAVALVWRDPEGGIAATDSESYAPHPLRILFYHPLE